MSALDEIFSHCHVGPDGTSYDFIELGPLGDDDDDADDADDESLKYKMQSGPMNFDGSPMHPEMIKPDHDIDPVKKYARFEEGKHPRDDSGKWTSKGILHGLAAEARKASSFEEFEDDFHFQIKHGLYWHVTDRKDFKLDAKSGPRDMSSMADGSISAGKFMVTSDLGNWLDQYEKRGYVALVDMSEVPRKKYWQVHRGFGNEFFVDDPSKAKVVKVLSRKEAERFDNAQHKLLPGSKEELRAFYDAAKEDEKAKKYERNFDESRIRRGDSENKGHFASKGGGGSVAEKVGEADFPEHQMPVNRATGKQAPKENEYYPDFAEETASFDPVPVGSFENFKKLASPDQLFHLFRHNIIHWMEHTSTEIGQLMKDFQPQTSKGKQHQEFFDTLHSARSLMEQTRRELEAIIDMGAKKYGRNDQRTVAMLIPPVERLLASLQTLFARRDRPLRYERDFDESKVSRDEAGKFAEKEDGFKASMLKALDEEKKKANWLDDYMKRNKGEFPQPDEADYTEPVGDIKLDEDTSSPPIEVGIKGEGKIKIREDTLKYWNKATGGCKDAGPCIDVNRDLPDWSHAYLSKASPEVAESIRYYSNEGYSQVNSVLRLGKWGFINDSGKVGGKFDKKRGMSVYQQVLPAIVNLQTAFEENRSGKPVTVYRGEHFLNDKALIAKMINNFDGAFTSGETVAMKGFISTSSDRKWIDERKDYPVMFEIKAKSGLDMRPLSHLRNENEFLIEHGSLFKVTGHDKLEDGRHLFRLEQL